jgi:parallel beta-helix repeat protein
MRKKSVPITVLIILLAIIPFCLLQVNSASSELNERNSQTSTATDNIIKEDNHIEINTYQRPLWVSPDGSLPKNYDTRKNPAKIGASELMLESAAFPNSEGQIYVLVNPNLYSGISASITQFVSDIQMSGYSVSLYTLTWQDSQAVRSLLQTGLSSGLEGAIFVGNIPAAWYEMGPPLQDAYEKFPTDLYYMDLDGNWTDADTDGFFDGHSGDVQPEIWVARIDASGLTEDESQFVNNYFTKEHRYRIGDLVSRRRALVYIDDDWTTWADEENYAIQQLYDVTDLVKDNSTTNANDYKTRLQTGSYEWVHLMCHGSSGGHVFKIPPDVQEDEWVLPSDYQLIDPQVTFYQFFVCSAARFIESDYLAGSAVFARNAGVLAIGSTKSGGMIDSGSFYTYLSQGNSIGDAFKQWLTLHVGSEPEWVYGMTIIGDPLLKPHLGSEVPSDYPKIQAAINAANDGDTIFVTSGTYYENVVTNKSISIVGENKTNTIIDGSLNGNVVNITVSNVKVSGFTIRRSGTNTDYSGIWISGPSTSNIITSNILTENYNGIYLLSNSANNTISENIVNGNTYNGIYLSASSNNTIRGNLAAYSSRGIELYYSSDNNTLEENNIVMNGEGLRIDYSSNNMINQNQIEQNAYGILLFYSTNNNIVENSVAGNNQSGIYIWSETSGNEFYHNKMDNPNQVHDLGSLNVWDNGYPSGGNYWSGYIDVDNNKGPYQNITGSDGIWDNPYIINSNNTDLYPLAFPYETQPPTITVLSPENKSYAVNDSIPLTFTVDEFASWIGYSLNEQANVTVTGNTTLPVMSDGLHYVVVYANDTFGNMGASDTRHFTVDTVAPTGSIVINNGDASTTSTSVTLTLTSTDATSGVNQVRYSNDGPTWSSWESASSTKAWTLTSGDGTKTVYYQIRDNAGLLSSTYSDTISLQSPSPSPTPSPSPSPQPTPSPSPTPEPTPTPTSSPQPTPSPTPPPEEQPILLYAIVVAGAFAFIGVTLFMLKKRRHQQAETSKV